MERTTEIFADLVQHRMSEATVLQASEALETCIAPSTEAVRGLLRDAAGLHVDESGLRLWGTFHWLHVACTERLTSYEVHAKRGHEAMEAAGILGTFRGTMVHDHWKPYFTYNACDHALCNAHHLRELRFIDTQYHQTWANDMAALLVEIKAAVAATPAPAMCLSPPELLAFATRYDAVVQAGFDANPVPVLTAEGAEKKRGRPKQPPPVNLLLRLRDFKGQVLAFMSDFRVPFDNNQGERDIRMVKVKQKVSGGFRTLEGAQRFGRIRGYLSTARKHTKNVFEAIRDAFEGTLLSLPQKCSKGRWHRGPQPTWVVTRHFIRTLWDEEVFPSVRLIWLSGELVDQRDIALCRKHFSSDCFFINGFGAAETPGPVLLYFVNTEMRLPDNKVPLGYVVEGAEVLLFDENGEEVGNNRMGEIAVKSCYLALGYWRQPERTRTAFRPDPSGGDARIYYTGDLGRWLPDGCLEHLGRKDWQVKIRGHRIEVVEVERALLEIPQSLKPW